jgi:hypothetical protein
MSEALKNLLACWREALATEGFIVCREDCAEGERFRIAVRDQSMVLELLYHDIQVTVPLSETSLRTKLMRMGLSTEEVDAKIQFARAFAEAKSPYMGPMVRFSN